MLLTYFLNDFEVVPVAPIITGIIFVFTFHIYYYYYYYYLKSEWIQNAKKCLQYELLHCLAGIKRHRFCHNRIGVKIYCQNVTHWCEFMVSGKKTVSDNSNCTRSTSQTNHRVMKRLG
jgi:hypothetical protein